MHNPFSAWRLLSMFFPVAPFRPGAALYSMYIHEHDRSGARPASLRLCNSAQKQPRSVTQFFDNTLRPSGLRATQFHILAEIRGAGEATVTNLTKLLVMDQTTLTRGLAILEREGLITTVPKPDARLKSVCLTTKGNRALASAFPLWSAAQKKMISTIGKPAWEAMGDRLEALAQQSSK